MEQVKKVLRFGHNCPIKKKMRLLAKSGGSFIYDDGDIWYTVNNDKSPVVEWFIPKKEKPLYPLAACLKWGFEPVDVKYLNALSEGGLDGVAEYLKNEKK
jgi:hypothetical protein